MPTRMEAPYRASAKPAKGSDMAVQAACSLL